MPSKGGGGYSDLSGGPIKTKWWTFLRTWALISYRTDAGHVEYGPEDRDPSQEVDRHREKSTEKKNN